MKNIIIVDDEQIILQGLVNFLDWEKHGYRCVLSSQNPQEAIDYMKEHPVDIILSDIVMPGLDGLDFLHYVKTHYPQTHVIFISSHEEFNYAQEAIRLGVSDYLIKSTLSPEKLLNRLNALKVEKQFEEESSLESRMEEEISALLQGKELRLDRLNDFFIHDYFYAIFIPKEALKYNFLSEIKNLHQIRIALKEDYSLCLVNVENPVEFQFPHSDEAVFISPSFQQIEDLRKWYLVFQKQEELLFYVSNERQICLDENFQWTEGIDFDYDKYHSLMDSQLYYHALDQFYEKVVSYLDKESMDPRELKSFASSTIYQFITSLESHDLKSPHIPALKLQMVHQIQSSNTADQLKQNIKTILENLSIIIQNYLKKDQQQFKTEILSFLESNFHEDINLQDLAEHMNFSYHYMSDLFRESFQKSFNEVLNSIRIKHAKDLLRKSHEDLQSIAEKVGFNNYSHFSKTFKNITGLSPSEFRRL